MKLTLRTLDGELSDLEVELSDYINSVATKVQKLKKPDEKVWIRMWNQEFGAEKKNIVRIGIFFTYLIPKVVSWKVLGL